MVKYEQYGFIHRQTTCLQEIYTFAESSGANTQNNSRNMKKNEWKNESNYIS